MPDDFTRQSRAENNGRLVAGQGDQPNQFQLGHTSFLAGQIITQKFLLIQYF